FAAEAVPARRARDVPARHGVVRLDVSHRTPVHEHERAALYRQRHHLHDGADLRTDHGLDVPGPVMSVASRPVLLVLASTYPRWPGDPEPGFVHELSRRLTDRFRVIALCPHAPGARTAERMDGVEVVRYRYA